MSRIPVAAGNWKLQKNLAEIQEFFREYTAGIPAGEREIVIGPTAIGLTTAVAAAKGSPVGIAAQNCYSQQSGAFTGEISPDQIKDAGGTHVILGHSERRHVFGETDADINKKIKLVLETGLVPIFCIGELLEEREAGKVEEVLERQITYGLEGIELSGPDALMIAYEPVWAIGTGKTAGPEDAQEAHAFTRSLMKKTYSESIADGVRILYGGSVKPDNAAGLMAMADVDGVLVGGASLKADSFLKITEAVKS